MRNLRRVLDAIIKLRNDNVALSICLVYALVSSIWIFFSDNLMFALVPRLEDAQRISIAKGVIFVLATSAIIYSLIRRGMRALEQSEATHRGLIEASPDAILLLDLSMSIAIANRRVVSLLGYSQPADLMGKSVYNIVRAQDGGSLQATLHALLQTRLVRNSQFTMLTKDGNLVSVESSASLIVDEKSAPKAVMIILRDITERLRSDHALREAEEKYRSIFEHASEGIFQSTPSGKFIAANPMLVSVLGYDSEEKLVACVTNIGRQLFVDHDRYVERGRQLEEHGQIMNFESELRRKDGTTIWVSENTRLVRNDVQGVEYYEGTVQDVTDRKQAEREIRLLAQTVASTKDCVSITDLDDKILFINDAFIETYGYDRDEVMGQSISILRSPTVPLAVRQEIRPTTLDGGWYGEIMNRKKDGTDFPVELWTSVVRNDAGEPVAMVGVSRDISRRKQVEESIAKLLRAIEQSDEVIFMTEPDGLITYVNPAFERVYGYAKVEAVGKTPRLLKSGVMSEEDYKSFWRSLLSGESVQREMINKRKDAVLVTMESSANPVVDADGKISGFIAVQKDITARKRLEEERKGLEAKLFQAQKMESVGTLAGGIAHDFNNILAIILGHATLLDHYNGDPVRFLKSRESIVSAVQRGAGLVKQILTFARRADILFEPTDVNETVVEFIGMLEETFPENINLSTSMTVDSTFVNADRTQLHQTLLNLCVNARDAMPHGGALCIKTERISNGSLKKRFPDVQDNDFVCLTVLDTGSGMDDTIKQRIFEPFFSTKPIGKGTGLGLAMVHGIMNTHKGFIDVESTKGVGTSFHLYFPVSKQSGNGQEKEVTANTVVSGRGETILVVDDEEALSDLVRLLLESNGYKAIIAATGEDAIRLYKERRDTIALVISDIGLPKMGGREAFRYLKKVNPDVKAILVTGYLEPELKSSMMKEGVKGFMQKPYAPSEILTTIREVLDAS